MSIGGPKGFKDISSTQMRDTQVSSDVKPKKAGFGTRIMTWLKQKLGIVPKDIKRSESTMVKKPISEYNVSTQEGAVARSTIKSTSRESMSSPQNELLTKLESKKEELDQSWAALVDAYKDDVSRAEPTLSEVTHKLNRVNNLISGLKSGTIKPDDVHTRDLF